MDFSRDEVQTELCELARRIVETRVTPDFLRAHAASGAAWTSVTLSVDAACCPHPVRTTPIAAAAIHFMILSSVWEDGALRPIVSSVLL